MTEPGCDIGLIGLGVMGQNLALNIASRGYSVAAYEPLADTVSDAAAFVRTTAPAHAITIAATPQALLDALRPPRAVLLMITAGAPVDQQLAALRPLLLAGDVIIDGGNSHYRDTQRRCREFSALGVHYLGVGVSGGEQGARFGPALMVGGSSIAGFERVQPLFRAIAARVDGTDIPCCAYLGDEAAGHFVKMIHNGIEYADMQLIAEVYHLLRAIGVPHAEMQRLFACWNEGELGSYLIDITADIMGVTELDSDRPLLELIQDRAGQKGTGLWASQAALELGVPAPTIIEAVNARALSALKEQRVVAERLLAAQAVKRPDHSLIEALPGALLAAKVCAYAQGFAVLRAASETYRWKLRFVDIAGVWRGGCIIRARLLEQVIDAFERNAELYNLLLDAQFQIHLQRQMLALRRVVASAVAGGVPTPGLGSALAYFDAFRCARLPANLIQAQRDYFGAHTYERVDKPGTFHTRWNMLRRSK